ncbi:unnamed protein product [Lactuca saligna]|uniref:Uncharacterized protein n=1 Tax=Lactuca saligna TaxID=75948 RepID=A0AA35YTD6_LACSI|nr:unnamed protein product [Lactuca saligna]
MTEREMVEVRYGGISLGCWADFLAVDLMRCFRKVIGIIQIVHANIAVRTVVELEVHFLHVAFVRKKLQKVKKIGYFPLLIRSPSPLVFRHFASFARTTVIQLHKYHKGTHFEVDEEMCGDDEDREALQETIKNMQSSTELVFSDISTERTAQIDGSSEQIEAVKQLGNEVISEVCAVLQGDQASAWFQKLYARLHLLFKLSANLRQIGYLLVKDSYTSHFCPLYLVRYGQPPPQQSPNAAPQGGGYAQPAPYSIL